MPDETQLSGEDLRAWNWLHDPVRQAGYERANWQHQTYYGPDVDPSSPDPPAELARRKQQQRQVLREAPPFSELGKLAGYADWGKFEREARPSQYVEENRPYAEVGRHPPIDTSQAEAAVTARYNPGPQTVVGQGPLSQALGFGDIGGPVPLPQPRPANRPQPLMLEPVEGNPHNPAPVTLESYKGGDPHNPQVVLEEADDPWAAAGIQGDAPKVAQQLQTTAAERREILNNLVRSGPGRVAAPNPYPPGSEEWEFYEQSRASNISKVGAETALRQLSGGR